MLEEIPICLKELTCFKWQFPSLSRYHTCLDSYLDSSRGFNMFNQIHAIWVLDRGKYDCFVQVLWIPTVGTINTWYGYYEYLLVWVLLVLAVGTMSTWYGYYEYLVWVQWVMSTWYEYCEYLVCLVLWVVAWVLRVLGMGTEYLVWVLWYSSTCIMFSCFLVQSKLMHSYLKDRSSWSLRSIYFKTLSILRPALPPMTLTFTSALKPTTILDCIFLAEQVVF